MGLPVAVGAGVLVEPEEVAVGPDAQLEELEVPAGCRLLELGVTLRAHGVAHIALALQEQGRLAPRTTVDGEHHLVEPRQAAALPVGHPVFWIAFQQGEFAQPELLQAIRSAPHDPVRLGAQPVG